MNQYEYEKQFCPTCNQEQETRTYIQEIIEELKLGSIYTRIQVWDCLVCKNTWSKNIERIIKRNE